MKDAIRRICKNKGVFSLFSLGLLLFFYYLRVFRGTLYPEGTKDPDNFYHLAISKLIAENGFLRTWPQVEGFGWAEQFFDKEFLFHVLTGLAYKFGGEAGVIACVALLGAAIVASLFYMGKRIAGTAVGTLAVALFLSNGAMAFRLSMLRPHLMSILLTLWIVYALLKRKPYLLFVASMGFALAYHAFYLVLIMMGLFFVVNFKRESSSYKLLLWGLGGLLLGSIANPYFPGNIYLGLQHLQVALGFGIPKEALGVGVEVRPIKADRLLKEIHIPMMLLLGAIFVIAKKVRFEAIRGRFFGEDIENRNFLWVFSLVVAYTAFSFLTPRSIELLLPFSCLMSVYVFLHWRGELLKLVPVVVTLATIQLALKPIYDQKIINMDQGWIPAISMTVDKIPAEDQGAKIFHEDWSMSPLLLYKRPDLRVIDVLDPTFLYLGNQRKSDLRRAIVSGQVSDPYVVMKNVFDADYAMVWSPRLIRRLEQDPNFERIWPKGYLDLSGLRKDLPRIGVPLYRLRETRIPNQKLDFMISRLPEQRSAEFWAKNPPDWKALDWTAVPDKSKGTKARSAMLDLRYWEKRLFRVSANGRSQCLAVRPVLSSKDVAAKFLTVGGGESLLLWRGDQLYYGQRQEEDWPTTSGVLLPLSEGHRGEFHLILCADGPKGFMGVSLALWDQGSIKNVCRSKFNSHTATKRVLGASLYQDKAWDSCLGRTAKLIEPYSGGNRIRF